MNAFEGVGEQHKLDLVLSKLNSIEKSNELLCQHNKLLTNLLEKFIEKKPEELQETTKEKHQLLNAQEAADYIGFSKGTMYRFSLEGKIKSYKIGGKVRFKKDDLDDFVQQNIEDTKNQYDLRAQEYLRNNPLKRK